ncbi:pH-response regulator protein palF/RIM8 [Colletotrichum sp. SAR11_57]|nr:pH-response regulator protein palF/RIM8 [Colletotrichum sp. SAR11_57]
MGAYSHSNGSVEETTSSTRSFFSRFALPIRSRTRNLADFHVRPDDPHRQYSAGDHVRGAVVLTVVKPVRITHLTVTLHGYVRVHKGPAVSEPPVANPALSGGSLTNSKMQAVDEKTITATIEMLKGGALPGDTVSVKVSVQHIKRIKSMHGVIVTMYRQGRIDTAPPASMFADIMTKEETKKLAKEDYYPRSRTGLGGLSLSSTSSLSVFRKDLSQSVAPLIIDPVTLETTVTASVKVPEDVFPTIKGVPGEMVSFKYQVEVLVDLGGRLASQLQGGGQPRVGQFAPGSAAAEGNNAVVNSWGGNVIDTDRLRREKGVISVVFEVILGTTDSSRLRGRSNTVRTYQMHDGAASGEDISSPWPVDDIHADDGESYWPLATPQNPGTLSRQPTITIQPTSPPEEMQAPAYIPPPQVPDEARLTDKERARRQEERLLPSQPPQTLEAGPSGASALEPNIYDAEDEAQPGPSAPHGGHHAEEQPSAPTLDDLSTAREARTEDKQELERQRLLNEASAPPEFPDDYDAGPSASAPPGDVAEPSAPALNDEEEDYGEQYSYRTEAAAGQSSHAAGSEPLPRYER